MELTVARVAGALAVMTSPSAALLLFCAAGQMLHGNVWAPLQAIVLFAGVVLPAAFVAAALSALAGSLLPRIVARIVSVAAWLGTLFACSFKGVPASGGGVQFHIASDPLAQAFFGSQPLLDYQGRLPPLRLSKRWPCSCSSSPLRRRFWPRPRPSPAGARTAVTDEPPLRIERTPMFISLDRWARTSTRSPAPSTTLRSTCLRA